MDLCVLWYDLAVSFVPFFSKSATRGMATRVPIVGGNWKLNAGNGTTKATVTELVNGLNSAAKPGCEVTVLLTTLFNCACIIIIP
jgi:hypothetical protein